MFDRYPLTRVNIDEFESFYLHDGVPESVKEEGIRVATAFRDMLTVITENEQAMAIDGPSPALIQKATSDFEKLQKNITEDALNVFGSWLHKEQKLSK